MQPNVRCAWSLLDGRTSFSVARIQAVNVQLRSTPYSVRPSSTVRSGDIFRARPHIRRRPLHQPHRSVATMEHIAYLHRYTPLINRRPEKLCGHLTPILTHREPVPLYMGFRPHTYCASERAVAMRAAKPLVREIFDCGSEIK